MTSNSLLTPRRILMTSDAISGVWTYTLELCRALAAYDVQVLVAVMGGPLRPEQREQVDQLDNVRVVESRFKLEWMTAPWRDVDAAGDWLLGLEREFNPDLIHLNGYAHGRVKFRARRIVVAHSCVLSWWQAVKGRSAPAEWNEYRRRVREGIQAVDCVVAPTAAMLNSLERNYGPLPPNEVIYKARRREEFCVREKEDFVFIAGHLWDEAKNIATLAEIAPQLPWSVMVAGDAAGLEGKGAQLQNVALLGRLHEREMAAVYARAAIYALPARYEPFGLSALEAALSGCALVLGDVPSLRELWKGAARFVAPTDSRAWREALRELMANPHLRNKLAAAARTRALELNPRRMAEAYWDTYREVLSVRETVTPQLEFRPWDEFVKYATPILHPALQPQFSRRA